MSQSSDKWYNRRMPRALTRSNETSIDLVNLVPFDVTLALLISQDINIYEVTDIVTEWMNDSFEAQIKELGLDETHSKFDSIILDERTYFRHLESTENTQQNPRELQEPENFYASFAGVSLWKHEPGDEVMDAKQVEDLQRQALLQDDRLLELLKDSTEPGLGEHVLDVRAYINPNQPSSLNGGSGSYDNMELIIVVAIIIACMAFGFLVFSLFWAWRFDQQRREEMDRTVTKKSASTGSDSDEDPRHPNKNTRPTVVNTPQDITSGIDRNNSLPSEVESPNNAGGMYPESVISEDISTSLSAYYQSGLNTNHYFGSNRMNTHPGLNDAASLSSMGSYGYSLDGYAPSMTSPTNSSVITKTLSKEQQSANEFKVVKSSDSDIKN